MDYTTKDEVIEIFADALGVDKDCVNDTANFEDYDWDDLQHYEMLCAMEEHFGIGLDEDRFSKITRVDELVAFIESELNENSK